MTVDEKIRAAGYLGSTGLIFLGLFLTTLYLCLKRRKR